MTWRRSMVHKSLAATGSWPVRARSLMLGALARSSLLAARATVRYSSRPEGRFVSSRTTLGAKSPAGPFSGRTLGIAASVRNDRRLRHVQG